MVRTFKVFGCFLIAVGMGAVVSCSPATKDVAIKEDITSKAKEDIDFAAVNYVVDRGTVVLTGLTPTSDAKRRAEKTVKGIAGVKHVANHIAIGPVVLDEDFPLKQKADSILMKYNKAQAIVENGQVVLVGKVASKEVSNIIKAMEQLPATNIDNQLQVE